MSWLGQRGAFGREGLDFFLASRLHTRCFHGRDQRAASNAHPTLFLILGDHTVTGTLRDANADIEPRVTVCGKYAFGAGHVGTGVYGDAPGFRTFVFPSFPGIVDELENSERIGPVAMIRALLCNCSTHSMYDPPKYRARRNPGSRPTR